MGFTTHFALHWRLRISLFITCYNDTLFPKTGQAVVTVLERLGHTVDFSEAQTCCGEMHYNNDYHAEAFPLMEKFLDDFRESTGGGGPAAAGGAGGRGRGPGGAEK